MVLPLLFSGVHSPTVWRPPCVWHEIKAHKYHNNSKLRCAPSASQLRRPATPSTHRTKAPKPPPHLRTKTPKPSPHLRLAAGMPLLPSTRPTTSDVFFDRHNAKTASSAGTTRRQRRPLRHSAKTCATALARPPRASIHLQLTVHISYLASAHKVALMVFVYSTG